MKGDFSRLRDTSGSNYTAVLIQQGRVQLDSDANEQQAIDQHLRLTALRDVVGATGAPHDAAGFGITVAASAASLTISAGRFYIDGLLCENLAPLDFAAQSAEPNNATPISVVLGQLRNRQFVTARVYLEAWQRFITAIDDPAIHEVALGQADTAGRRQTAWRVVAEPIASTTNATGLAAALTNLQTALQALASNQNVALGTVPAAITTAVTSLQATGAGGAAVDQARTAWSAAVQLLTTYRTAQPLARPAALDAALAAANALGQMLAAQPSAQTCCSLPAFQPLRAPGLLSAQALPTAPPSAGIGNPGTGYRGLENQLYRVEIHTGGTAAQATFKWSRDNGSVVTQILGGSGPTLQVASLGPDTELGFAGGQWVEITDDSDEFANPPGQPGTLVLIAGVDPTQSPPTVTLSGTAPAFDVTRHAKLRRWDQVGGSGPIALQAGTWMALENGVQVQFSTTGQYAPGDHWLIPARTATGTIDWPAFAGQPAAAAPFDLGLRRTALACLHLDSLNNPIADDCRTLFKPLGQLTPPPSPPPALHVTAVSWTNDDLMTLDTLTFKGLSVTLDSAPTGPIDSRNFQVTLCVPYPVSAAIRQGQAAGQALAPVLLQGVVASANGVLTWSLPTNAWAEVWSLTGYSEFFAASKLYMRAYVTLKGHAVMGSVGTAPAWLDGQCFGKPGTRSDGTPRVDLTLPSGNAAKASDFEGWFDVAPVAVPTLSLAPTTLALTPSAPRPTVAATLGLSFNALADTPVTLSLQTTVNNQTAPGSNFVSVPGSVTMTRGTTSSQFTVSVIGNPGANVTATVTISASAALPSGYTPVAQATLTITGFPPTPVTGGTIVGPGGGVINFGTLLANQETVNPGLLNQTLQTKG